MEPRSNWGSPAACSAGGKSSDALHGSPRDWIISLAAVVPVVGPRIASRSCRLGHIRRRRLRDLI